MDKLYLQISNVVGVDLISNLCLARAIVQNVLRMGESVGGAIDPNQRGFTANKLMCVTAV